MAENKVSREEGLLPEDLQVYELGYLLLPSIAEGEVASVEAKIKEAVAAALGQELASEAPEKIDLAYSMTKVVGASRYVVNEAYIGWVKFEAEPSQMPALKEKVAKMDEVVRSLLVKAPRETTFTFAQAREALLEKEAAKHEAQKEEGAPKEAVVE
jgi:ribosomal protein S6